MYSSSLAPGVQQQPTLADIVRYLEGAAQALSWLYLVEEKRQPALAAAAFHLTAYADAARKAIDTDNTDTLDTFVTLRLGAMASLLAVIRDHWIREISPVTDWAADALAEIAYWLEVLRQAIDRLLNHLR